MNWKTYFTEEDKQKDNFQAVVQIADDQLDDENWPVSMIVMQDGIIIQQIPVHSRLTSDKVVYELPNMMGWTTKELAEWMDIWPEPNQSCHDINLIAYIEE